MFIEVSISKHHKSVILIRVNTPLTSKSLPNRQFPDQLINFCLQSSTMCMEKSLVHGKTDKPRKIALKRKIHTENWILIKRNFKVENGKITALPFMVQNKNRGQFCSNILKNNVI